MAETIAERVIKIVETASGKAADLSASLDALGLDSLETLDLFVSLDIPDGAVENFYTVGDIVHYLETRIN